MLTVQCASRYSRRSCACLSAWACEPVLGCVCCGSLGRGFSDPLGILGELLDRCVIGLVPVQALGGCEDCLLQRRSVSECLPTSSVLRCTCGRCRERMPQANMRRSCKANAGRTASTRRRYAPLPAKTNEQAKARTHLLVCPSTGLGACLRAPSSAFPLELLLNCCLPLPAAMPLSPFTAAVDMAARVSLAGTREWWWNGVRWRAGESG